MLTIDATLEALTLEEKAALVSGADFWHTVGVDRLDLPATMCADGPHGAAFPGLGIDHAQLGELISAIRSS